MSWAPTSRRGLALNCRLLVKGIQKASRLLGEASKFATSTVEVMMGSASGEGWRDITSDRRRRQTGGRAGPSFPLELARGAKTTEAPHAQRGTRCAGTCRRAGGRRAGSGGRSKSEEGPHAQRRGCRSRRKIHRGDAETQRMGSALWPVRWSARSGPCRRSGSRDSAEGAHAQRCAGPSARRRTHPCAGNGQWRRGAARPSRPNRSRGCGGRGRSGRGLRRCAVPCSGRHGGGSGRCSWPAAGSSRRRGCGRRSGERRGNRPAGRRSAGGRGGRPAGWRSRGAPKRSEGAHAQRWTRR